MSAVSPPGFQVLVKPTGAICNLGCHYCFFLSKENLYPGSTFRMPEALLEAYIQQLFEASNEPEVMVSWQGGEPTLMGLGFFERSIELVNQYKKPNQRVSYSIQTNGTRLDEAWCRFLRRHDFLVGLSIDGPKHIHDTYRVDKSDQGTFEDVLRGWEMLAFHQVRVNVLCTVHAANAAHPVQIYRYFRDELGAQFIQFIPIVERATSETLPLANLGWAKAGARVRPLYTQAGRLVTRRSVKPKQYGRFLIEIFEEWVRHDVGRVFVQMFDVALANWVGEPPGLCVFAETCGQALAVEHNGDLYACDHYVEPDYLLGNIRQTHLAELVRSARQVQFGLEKRDALPRYCRECTVRFACHGGCPRNRFVASPASSGGSGGESGLNYLCAGYKAFFTHIDEPMRLMARMLHSGQPPADVMRWYATQDAKRMLAYASARPGEPCPCGSGKRYRHCHGRRASRAAVTGDIDRGPGPHA
jgi:uncharacterized protein